MEKDFLCTLCPQECRVNRKTAAGFCGAPNGVKAALSALHFWEEPCISGSNGSGTIFFSGCPLSCVYCQNRKISYGGFGKEISVSRLAEIFCELQAKGAHNINLVSPTPYVMQILEAIELSRSKIKIPFVYNTGGYEKPETLKLLRGYINIYLTDIKYFSKELSVKYSAAPSYFPIAMHAAEEMISQTGSPVFGKNGILKSGTIIRHLVLPSHRRDSIEILKELSRRFSPDSFLLSLMSQYTPNTVCTEFPELQRRITSFEYKSVLSEAVRLGLTNGYMQEKSSAKEEYTPDFNLSGI